MSTTTFFARITSFFTKKRIIWTVVILVILALGYLIFGNKSAGTNIQTGAVTRQDIKKTVLTTGQVVSSTNLDLSFAATGIVRKVYVKEGDVVAEGQTLAVLDQSSASASLESAQGSFAQAQANYNKVKAAASAQDIAVSQAAVDSAQTTLQNAKQNLLRAISDAYNNANTAVLTDTNNLFSNAQTASPQFGISGTTQTNSQLANNVNGERVTINTMLAAWQTEVSIVSDSNSDTAVQDSITNLNTLGNFFTDLMSLMSNYTQASGASAQSSLTAAETAVSSGKSVILAASATLTTDMQAIHSAQSQYEQAQASLALKQAPARPEDVAIAQAQMLSVQGQLHAAQATLDNTVLRAPARGTITQIDIKLGEQAQALKEVMKLQDVGQLYAEADVSEADIAEVQPGQTIDNVFDALGPDQHFQSKVLTVNPASTVISGVVDYKVTGSLDNIPGIKPGMTTNMTILVAQKSSVLTAPSSAIVNKDGKKYIKVIDDPKKKTYHEVEVTTGLEADGGVTEITSGLTEGQTVVTYIK